MSSDPSYLSHPYDIGGVGVGGSSVTSNSNSGNGNGSVNGSGVGNAVSPSSGSVNVNVNGNGSVVGSSSPNSNPNSNSAVSPSSVSLEGSLQYGNGVQTNGVGGLESKTSTNGNGGDGDQGIYKLFVGQIPPFTSEETLRNTFSVYGLLTDVVILKDRHTGAHKGCGFVCYNNRNSADLAIASLADKVKLPNAKREMIVRYAGERPDEKEFKLYVCMLSRQSNESEVRALFEPFGQLTEVFIIRSREGNHSKGAAFVKFTNRDDAVRAVEAIHDKVKDKDAPGLVQVRFAHTKEERAAHLAHVLGLNHPHHPFHSLSTNPSAAAAAAAAAFRSPFGSPQGLYGTNPQGLNYGAGLANKFGGSNSANSPFAANVYATFAGRGVEGMGGYNAAANAGQYGYGSDAAGSYSQQHFTNHYQQQQQQQQQHTHSSSSSLPSSSSSSSSSSSPSLSQPHSSPVHSSSPVGLGKDIRGPEGANVFCYNLPETYGEADLATLFGNFGHVLSTRIQRDLGTGVSKGFGFVSFDEPQAAQSAIQALDGFAIGNKRLTVRLKTHHPHHPHNLGGLNIGVGGVNLGVVASHPHPSLSHHSHRPNSTNAVGLGGGVGVGVGVNGNGNGNNGGGGAGPNGNNAAMAAAGMAGLGGVGALGGLGGLTGMAGMGGIGLGGNQGFVSQGQAGAFGGLGGVGVPGVGTQPFGGLTAQQTGLAAQTQPTAQGFRGY